MIVNKLTGREKSTEFYQIGISANKTGISVYILGINDKTYLANTYGKKLGKATVTGYCIKFKTLKDINIDILEAAIRYGVEGGALTTGLAIVRGIKIVEPILDNKPKRKASTR
jgi:hypothetical protein